MLTFVPEIEREKQIKVVRDTGQARDGMKNRDEAIEKAQNLEKLLETLWDNATCTRTVEDKLDVVSEIEHIQYDMQELREFLDKNF